MNKFILESETVSMIKRDDSAVFMESNYHHLFLSPQYSELHIEASLPCLLKRNTCPDKEEEKSGDISIFSQQYALQDCRNNASIDDKNCSQLEAQVRQQQLQQQQQQQPQEKSSRPVSPDPNSRIDDCESDTKDHSQTRQEESEASIEATEAGSLNSRTSFFSRNSVATAALRKKRDIEKRFSPTLMSKASRKISTGTNTKTANALLLKKRALERRYSSVTHKELSHAVRKAAAISHKLTNMRSQQASENGNGSMLEASSALIASVLPPPLAPMEEPLSSPPAPTPVQEESSIPKVQLMEDLLEEKGCLVVLCSKSTETRDNNICMDQYSDALFLCYDVPVYRMIDVEEDLDTSQKLLGISRKSIYPQFFFERLSCEENNFEEEEFGMHETDDKTKGNVDDKYIYLGGISTVKAMLLERMAYQWRSSERLQRKSI